jgi:hypothetical protein
MGPRLGDEPILWVHLQALSNNTFALPVSDRNGQRRLWLTRFIGLGSTGKVWQGHFDNSDDSFAIKIVELLYPSDMDSRQRLRNEFNVYLIIEAAYQSKRLRDRITPRCYGDLRAMVSMFSFLIYATAF